MKTGIRKFTWVLSPCLALGLALSLVLNFLTTSALADTNTVSSNSSSGNTVSVAPSATAKTTTAVILPGYQNMILGADVSIWQHQGSAKINFNQMYSSGIRFVFIKGSDSIPKYDSQAKKYLFNDRRQAQAAGLYTGIYHYATLPKVSDTSQVILDALRQSRIVYQRIASFGGLNQLDLPPVLDLESNCTAADNAGNCTARLNPKDTTTWALTFLRNLSHLTGRTAILNTFPTFLQNDMARDPLLTQYPLWIAQYGYSPDTPDKQPGATNVGCIVTAWTSSDCLNHWTLWQFSSCGIGKKHGLSSGRLDLNVFSGSTQDFQNLQSGNWAPKMITQFPFDQPTNGVIETITASDSNHAVIITAKFLRPDNSPVITGKVTFTNGSSTQSSGSSAFIRNDNGDFVLTIRGLKGGSYIGTVDFTDPSEVAASLSLPVTFQVNSVAPLPAKKPSGNPAPYDYCAHQFNF
jgi:lysozyme